jgi:hypothetical protein
MALFRRRPDPYEVRRVVSQVGRRERRLGWMRRLPPADLDRLVAEIEKDIETNPTRDSLLEHVARLHYDTQARTRMATGTRTDRLERDSARCAVEAAIFERRYGERMLDAIGGEESVDDEWEQANLYVEGALRRLGVTYAFVGPGHWLYETSVAVVHLHHYPGQRILDVYAPLSPVPDGDREELYAELLAENGSSIAGAFYGVCSFGESGDHVCSCARLATEHLAGPDLVYALNSVTALADRYHTNS